MHAHRVHKYHSMHMEVGRHISHTSLLPPSYTVFHGLNSVRLGTQLLLPEESSYLPWGEILADSLLHLSSHILLHTRSKGCSEVSGIQENCE